MKRYIVERDTVPSRFPFLVIDVETGAPALWKPKTKAVAQRFRTEALAQAAADKLNAETKPKR